MPVTYPIPDLPTSVSVHNAGASPVYVDNLPPLAPGTTVIDLTSASGINTEWRKQRRWNAIERAVAAGVISYTSPNLLWGKVRIKNLTASPVVLDQVGLINASDSIDVDLTDVSASQRIRFWVSIEQATGNGVILYEPTPSTDVPTVVSVSPSQGDLAGTLLTITGIDFAPGATVTVNGIAATNVTWVNAHTITAMAPAAAAGGPYAVVVQNSVGYSGTLAAAFTYVAPTFVSVTPSTVDLAGGSVTIIGTDFVVGAGVTIGGVAAGDVVVVSPTEITCTVPVLSAGAKAIVVTNPGSGAGTVTAAAALTVTAATITTPIIPATGSHLGGTSITINGTNFKPGATVTVGGNPATAVVFVNSTQLTATVPAGAAGAVAVAVTNPGTGGSVAFFSRSTTTTQAARPAFSF